MHERNNQQNDTYLPFSNLFMASNYNIQLVFARISSYPAIQTCANRVLEPLSSPLSAAFWRTAPRGACRAVLTDVTFWGHSCRESMHA